MTSSAQEYIDGPMRRIPGWFSRLDAQIFDLLLRVQTTRGLAGGLLEIGTYHGRSAILLGHHQQPGEVFTVCDVFDDDPHEADEREEKQRYYPGLARQDFENAYLAHHPKLPVVVQAPSSDLHGRSLAGHRFIHVDGAHTYDAVDSDAKLAMEILLPGGVVVFDDIRTRHAPGVAAAVWRHVDGDRLVPFCLTEKLYCWRGRPEHADNVIDELAGLGTWHQHEICGQPVLETAGAQGLRRVASHWLLPPAISDRLRRFV